MQRVDSRRGNNGVVVRPAAIQALLSGVVDYAGLFPPALLALGETASNYADYLAGPNAWMLGRLIVPVAQLDKLRPLAARNTGGPSWQVSAILGDNAADEANSLAAFNSTTPNVCVSSAEYRFSSVEHAAEIKRLLPENVELYAEVPLRIERKQLQQFAAIGVRAKVRTGGVVPGAFPDARDIASFLRAAAGVLPVKFTAGLHHPVRSLHNLTYAADAPSGIMHGFLNMFVAASFAYTGRGEMVEQVLLEEDAESFRFSDEGIRWRQQTIPLAQVHEARTYFARSFGSCSFTEPLQDLTTLALL